jgi:hypothetical protein
VPDPDCQRVEALVIGYHPIRAKAHGVALAEWKKAFTAGDAASGAEQLARELTITAFLAVQFRLARQRYHDDDTIGRRAGDRSELPENRLPRNGTFHRCHRGPTGILATPQQDSWLWEPGHKRAVWS